MANNKADTNPNKRALDLSAVWSRGVRLLRDNIQLIAILAGVFVLLPNAALQFTLPSSGEMEGPLNVVLDPSSSQAMQEKAALALGEMMSPFLMWVGAVLVIAHVGYAAIIALIGRARPTVGQALAQSLRVILPLILAIIITFVALYSALFVIQLVLTPMGPAVAAFVGSVLGALIAFYLTARLYLTLPVMVVEWQLNPVKAMLRSWRLTSSNPGNVFGFWMLMATAWFMSMLFQVVISSLLSGIAGPGPTAALIQGLCGGLFSMVWGAIYCAMGVAMHAALTEADGGAITPASP